MLLNKHSNLQSIYKMKNTLNNDLLNLVIDTEQTILTARSKTKGIGSTSSIQRRILSQAEGFDFERIRTVTSR